MESNECLNKGRASSEEHLNKGRASSEEYLKEKLPRPTLPQFLLGDDEIRLQSKKDGPFKMDKLKKLRSWFPDKKFFKLLSHFFYIPVFFF